MGMSRIEDYLLLNKPAGRTVKIEEKKPEQFGVKLPKIVVKKFTGEPTEWMQFSDTFKATVEANTRLSNI